MKGGALLPDEIKKQIVEIARLMYSKNMVNTFEGNISARYNDKIYITPSGKCKGFLDTEMIAVTDLNGNVEEGKPSSEIKLHLEAYRLRPDIQGVVHAHTPYSTAFALANKPIETKAYPELITFFGEIPLVKYGTPSTNEIFEGLHEHILSHDVVLLANHGVMAAGKDVFDAFFKLEAVESIAKVLYLSQSLGGEKELSADKLEEIYRLKKAP